MTRIEALDRAGRWSYEHGWNMVNRSAEFLTEKDLVEAETLHEIALRGMEAVQRADHEMERLPVDWVQPLDRIEKTLRVEDERLEQELWGEELSNPVGVAAGFDKNGRVVPFLESLGFGYVEVGGVTPEYQEGNPQPRLWRGKIPGKGLVNDMGFNNHGAETIARRLEIHNGCFGLDVPVAVNVGEVHTGEEGVEISHGYDNPARFEDSYDETVIETAETFDDELVGLEPAYFTAVISCPNTAGETKIEDDLDDVEDIVCSIDDSINHPFLVKISPDSSQANIRDTVQVVEPYADGFVATNTSSRVKEHLKQEPPEEVSGGLSGEPVTDAATETVAKVYDEVVELGAEDKPVIGVGGVSTAQDAYDKILAGASAVQLCTGLVYQGPTVARDINKGLLEKLDENGYRHVSGARGEAYRQFLH